VISAQAAALAKEALATMVFTKVKVGTALLLFLSVLTAGTGWALPRASEPNRRELKKALLAKGEPEPKREASERRSTLFRPQMDFFGDPLPNQAIARLGTVRFRHNGPIYAIAFSPDGQLIASAASHGQVRLWNAATGQRVQSLDDPDGSVKQCVAFSPDGKLLTTHKGYTGKGDAAIWDVATGKILCCLDRKCPGTIYSMDFAPDGRSLVLASNSNDEKAIWFFYSATGQVLRRLEGHGQTVCAAVFSKDGKRLASASKDRTARLWDLTNDKVLRELPHGEEVVDVALSPDGKHLASKTIKAVYLWDLDSGKELHRFDRQSAPIRSLAFSPDGKLLASEGILWEVATRKKRCECENNPGYSTAFSPDGKVVATGGFNGLVHQYDPATRRELPQSLRGWNRGPLSSVQFSSDGKAIITRGNDGVSVWNAATWQPVYRLPRTEDKLAVAISPDNKTLATLGLYGTIDLWDATTGQALRRMRVKVDHRNGGLIPTLVFSPDGKTLASAGYSNTIHLWSATAGQEIQQLAGHERGIYALAFAPNGKSLISASLDETRRYWDLATGRECRREKQDGWIRAFSPDGRWYAKSLDSTLTVCDLRSGKEIRKLEGVGCNWCAFSPDGKTIAVDAAQGGSPESEQRISLLEVATGKVRRAFTGHRGFLMAAAFSPDGKKLASASFDTTCLIWDVTGGQPSESSLAPKELKELWHDLASFDATRAYQAIWRLAGTAKQTLPLLRVRLRPIPPVDRQQIGRWIADLDSAHFKVRQKATTSLEVLEELAEPALRASLDRPSSAELRQRVEELLRRIPAPIDSQLQSLRAIEVLEQIGTPEARHLLEALGKGAPETRLTQEANASLERLAKRHDGE
jgi:WD40 repeat protein